MSLEEKLAKVKSPNLQNQQQVCCEVNLCENDLKPLLIEL